MGRLCGLLLLDLEELHKRFDRLWLIVVCCCGRPLRWGRGLTCRQVAGQWDHFRRPLRWGRGLKSLLVSGGSGTLRVVPYAGTWIEILSLRLALLSCSVVPYAGDADRDSCSSGSNTIVASGRSVEIETIKTAMPDESKTPRIRPAFLQVPDR